MKLQKSTARMSTGKGNSWLLVTLIFLCGIQLSLTAGPWEKARLELHEYTVSKMSKNPKLKELNRKVNTLYQKLDLLLGADPEIKKLRLALTKTSGKGLDVLRKKLNEAEAKFLTQGTIEAEEAQELLETLGVLNKKIYAELNKDEEFRRLRKYLKEVTL